MGERSGAWKGDKVGYAALHNWVKRWSKKPKWCHRCKNKPPYDLANISQQYKRNLKDWEWLCRKCHMTKDGRLKKLVNKKYGEKYGRENGMACSIPILQKDLNGKTINEFYSQNEASRKTGVSLQNINQVVRGYKNRETAGGFRWKLKRV